MKHNKNDEIKMYYKNENIFSKISSIPNNLLIEFYKPEGSWYLKVLFNENRDDEIIEIYKDNGEIRYKGNYDNLPLEIQEEILETLKKNYDVLTETVEKTLKKNRAFL